MKYATPVVSLLIIIAVLTPGGNLPDVKIGGYDKLIHFGMFLAWTLALCYDFGTRPRSRYFVFLITGAAFSVLTEALQILIEGRSFDVYDMAADMAGVATGLLISAPVLRWVKWIIGG